MEEPDDLHLTKLHIDVYDTKAGPWNPEYGAVTIPDNWELLPSGDAFVTRHVKKAGVYWLAWRPRTKGRGHRRQLGLWAPASTIERARAAAEQTSAARARAREQGARQRARGEATYRDQLFAAVLKYLDFAPEHAELAAQIAKDAADRASVVGSGRVGRTRIIPLEERAQLAARASIRHRHTDYESRLDDALLAADALDFVLDDFEYKEIKAEAHQAVDRFIADHRSP